MNKNMFEVKYGSLYNAKTGCIVETMAAIIDKGVGLLKYGSATDNLYGYYLDMMKKYKEIELEDMANNLLYIEFDRYNGILTIEEICTFANYMVMCSGNGETISKMLQMSGSELKEKIKMLASYGY